MNTEHAATVADWLRASADTIADKAPQFAQEAASLERATGATYIAIALVAVAAFALAVWRYRLLELKHEADNAIPRLAGYVVTVVFVLALTGKGVQHWIRGTYAPRVVVAEKAAAIVMEGAQHP